MIAMGAAPEVIVGSVHAVTEDGARGRVGERQPARPVRGRRGAGDLGGRRAEGGAGPRHGAAPGVDLRLPREHDRHRHTGNASFVGKLLIMEREFLPGRGTAVLVREEIGF
jgi:hypothetical protein